MKNRFGWMWGLSLLALGMPSCVHRGASTLYYGAQASREIGHLPTSGGTPTAIASGQSTRALAFDPCGEKLIEGTSILMRYDLDGKNKTALVTRVRAQKMAIDHRNGHLYWTDSSGSVGAPATIERCDLADGGNRTTVLTGIESPNGITVDRRRGMLYWTASGMWRSDVDGSHRERINVNQTIKLVAVDSKRSRLYFVDRLSKDHGIFVSELDGSNPTLLVSIDREQNNIRDLAVDPVAKKLYWETDVRGKQATIWRCDLKGTNVEALHRFSDSVPTVGAIALGFGPNEKGLRKFCAKWLGRCF